MGISYFCSLLLQSPTWHCSPCLSSSHYSVYVQLKAWHQQNKLYITIAQVTESKKTNKMVFVWRKSAKDMKNRSPSNIAFLILSFKHRFKHGSGFWPLVIMVPQHLVLYKHPLPKCLGTVCTSIPVQLPCLLGVIDQWRVTVIVAVHSPMINPENKYAQYNQ